MNKTLISAVTGKSKTIDVNVIGAAVVAILTAFGIALPVEAVTAFFTIANIFLRFITKESLADKVS